MAGEYVGLTGTRLDGAEMLACGLATHYVPSEVYVVIANSCLKPFLGEYVTFSDHSTYCFLLFAIM